MIYIRFRFNIKTTLTPRKKYIASSTESKIKIYNP